MSTDIATTEAVTQLDWPRMLGRAEGRLSCIFARAHAVAECITDPDELRRELRDLARQADEAAQLGKTDPITLTRDER